MTDVVIVGGGVIGLSIAYELAGQGVDVTVLERRDFGSEASWAGAGILPPGNPKQANTPEARLRSESHVLWAELSSQLYDETGIDNGYRNCGGIEVSFSDDEKDLAQEMQFWKKEGVEIENLPPDILGRFESQLSPHITAAYRLPELSQVRNPRHLKALLIGCSARGVNLIPGTAVIGFEQNNNRITAARTESGTISADRFLVAGGAWSKQIVENAGFSISLEPVRGQIAMLSTVPLPIHHIIQQGPRYLVPRPDGRILIGSTEESVGFEKRNTAKAISELIQFGTSLVPDLANANFERAWSGLRPCSADGLPYLGLVPGQQNLFLAAGHFRAGLQMSPATAQVMRQLILEQQPAFSLEGLSVDRHEAIPFNINS